MKIDANITISELTVKDRIDLAKQLLDDHQEAISILQKIVDDFDQAGCSDGVGVVRTSIINQARDLLGLDSLKEEEEEHDFDLSNPDLDDDGGDDGLY